jgi:predicted transcriptional regulator of viral defense system
MDDKIKKGEYISTILRSKQTVFSVKDIMLLWGEPISNAARVRINYYLQSGDLYRVRRGLYVKDQNYDRLELATKIFTPSYVSFETVLGRAGVTFQYYSQIFIASYITREIKADDQKYSYRKIKDKILTNHLGVEAKDNYSVASAERAFLDIVYLNKDYHFDNLLILNWDKVFEILPIYGGNKRMEKIVKKYHEGVKAQN